MSLRPAVRRLAAALLPCLLFAGGCASPTTGRVRDAHLLWEGDPAKRQIASFEQFGPFYQRVESARFWNGWTQRLDEGVPKLRVMVGAGRSGSSRA